MTRCPLSFVSERFPDQTLYSWVAMYHLLSGASSESETCRTLFGSSNAGRHFHIPSHLDFFCERTQSALGSPKDILEFATILPFYTHFRSPRIVSEVLEKVRGPQVAGLAQILGIYSIGQHSFPQPKGCIECAGEDQRDYGYSYWHRAHQLPCTLVCHKHGTLLFGVRSDHRHSRHAHFISPTPEVAVADASQAGVRIRKNEHELLDRLALIAKEMMGIQRKWEWDRSKLGSTFLAEVRKRDVWSSANMLDPRRLELDFLEHFREVLEIREFIPSLRKRGIYSVWCLIEGVDRPIPPDDWVMAIEWLFGSWAGFIGKYSLQSSSSV